MAGRGSAPKMPEQRRSRVPPMRGEWVDLPTERCAVPLMPEGEWSARTRSAWTSWWSDPAATQWTDADWEHVVQLLELTEAFYSDKMSFAGEMRLRADSLGLTQKGKRDLRWRVADAEPVVAPVRPAADRRKRLKVV